MVILHFSIIKTLTVSERKDLVVFYNKKEAHHPPPYLLIITFRPVPLKKYGYSIQYRQKRKTRKFLLSAVRPLSGAMFTTLVDLCA